MTGRVLLALGLGLTLVARSPPVLAQGPAATPGSSSPAVGTPEAIAAARVHFNRGRDLYQTGSYREAIVELNAARALDPKAKDLVFNLAIVHEKLAQIDEALRYARLYAVMDLEPAERTRAETYIKRLEGAKAEVIGRKTLDGVAPVAPLPPAETRTRGRLDVATIVVAAVAVGAAGAGTILGIKALADQVPSNAVTGTGGSTFAGEKSAQSSAHTEAVAADACFGGAAAAAIAAAVLYFARYRDAPRASAPPPPSPSPETTPSGTSSVSLTLAPLLGRSAGGLLVGGTF